MNSDSEDQSELPMLLPLRRLVRLSQDGDFHVGQPTLTEDEVLSHRTHQDGKSPAISSDFYL